MWWIWGADYSGTTSNVEMVELRTVIVLLMGRNITKGSEGLGEQIYTNGEYTNLFDFCSPLFPLPTLLLPMLGSQITPLIPLSRYTNKGQPFSLHRNSLSPVMWTEWDVRHPPVAVWAGVPVGFGMANLSGELLPLGLLSYPLRMPKNWQHPHLSSSCIYMCPSWG